MQIYCATQSHTMLELQPMVLTVGSSLRASASYFPLVCDLGMQDDARDSIKQIYPHTASYL